MRKATEKKTGMMRAFDKSILNNPNSFYFGKIPSRSDFVKSASGTKVISLMDQWIAHGMEMLMAMPGWKTSFDNASPFDFLFLGMKRRHAIHGTLAPSRDASARRFPFIAATSFELANPLQFLRLGPLALEKTCRNRHHVMSHAIEAQDLPDSLDLLNNPLPDSELRLQAAEARCTTYLAAQSLASLEAMLASGRSHVPLRQMVLTLGNLLLPLRTASIVPPQKAIALPLPYPDDERIDAMSFWLQLISISLTGSSAELSLFSGLHLGCPRLIIAFNGVTPLIFQSLFDEQAAQDIVIDLARTPWNEHHDSAHPACATLSSHLKHDDLSAQQLIASFRTTFG